MSGRTMANTNRPVSSVTAVRTFPWVLLVSVTVTPGSTPPCGSWMEPVTEALVVCARSSAGIPAASNAARANRNKPLAFPVNIGSSSKHRTYPGTLVDY